MRNLLRRGGHKKFNPGTAASMFFLNATDPATIKLTKKLMIDWGYKAQRLAYRFAKSTGVVRAQTKRPPPTLGKPPLKSQVDPLHQQADARRPAEAHVARAARHRGRRDRADHPRPGEVGRRRRRRVLLPGLRLGAAVLAGGARHAGDAVPRRRADGAAAGLPVLRLPADVGGQPRRGPADHRPPTACCSTAWPTRSTTSTSGR